MAAKFAHFRRDMRERRIAEHELRPEEELAEDEVHDVAVKIAGVAAPRSGAVASTDNADSNVSSKDAILKG